MTNRCFIIAEIGVNHNGDLELARRLIDVAVDAGADAAKIQTFKAEDLIVAGTKTVEYQRKNGAEDDQFKLLKSLELSHAQHHQLVEYCAQKGIEFMSTGFDIASLQFLVDLGIKRIKIPSGEITNTPLVEVAARTGLPIIISTGMATLEEVGDCVRTVRDAWREIEHDGDLCVLHCTTAYPTDLPDVNLSAMATMHKAFDEKIGYSDHTAGIVVPPLAVAAGARVLEKHITLDRKMQGPDHAASIEPDELKRMVTEIRLIETILGDGTKVPKAVELDARSLVRKGLKFARDLPKGHVISNEDLVALRPETGLRPARLKSLIGRTLAKPAAAHGAVEEGHFEP